MHKSFFNQSEGLNHKASDAAEHREIATFAKGLMLLFFGRKTMFRWAIIFAVVALIASVLGFGGVAGLSADFAWIFLVVAVILAIVGFVFRGKAAV